jgi:allantoinase
MDADVAVLAPGKTIHDSTRNPDGPGWSAYDGETFVARSVATYVRGRLAWDGSAVTAPAGHGKFARRG